MLIIFQDKLRYMAGRCTFFNFRTLATWSALVYFSDSFNHVRRFGWSVGRFRGIFLGSNAFIMFTGSRTESY